MSLFRRKFELDDGSGLSIAEQLRIDAHRDDDKPDKALAKRRKRAKKERKPRKIPFLHRGESAGVEPGTDVPVGKQKHVLPRINILPPALILSNRRRGVVRMFYILGVGMSLIVALAWFSRAPEVGIAAARLATTQEGVQKALNDVSRLQPIGDFMTGLETRVNLAVRATNQQVAYADILSAMKAAAPAGVEITEVAINYVAPQGDTPSTCGQENDPLANTDGQALYGCVAFSGTSTSTAVLNQFMRDLDTVPALKYTFIIPGAAAASGSGVTFTGTSAVTQSAAMTAQSMSVIDLTGVTGITVANPEAAPTDPAAVIPDPAAAPSGGTTP